MTLGRNVGVVGNATMVLFERMRLLCKQYYEGSPSLPLTVDVLSGSGELNLVVLVQSDYAHVCVPKDSKIHVILA